MTTQTEEATRPASVEQQVGRLEGGYDQLSLRVGSLEQSVDRLRAELTAKIDAQGAARERLRDETNANFAAQTAATDKLRADMNANFAAQTAARENLRDDLTAKIDAQGESLRAEIRSRFNTLLVVGATVGAALFTAMVGGFVAIFLRL